MTLASSYRRGLWAGMLSLITTTGCLVTKKVEFEQESNLPPSIESAPSAASLGTALNQIVQANLDDPQTDGGVRELLFPVIVRDPNVNQRLQWRLFVDFPLVRAPRAGDRLEPSGEIDRPFQFAVPLSNLVPPGRCHKVELLISGAFSTVFPFREPEDPGDLATGVWWVRSVDSTLPTVEMSTCPAPD